MHAARLVPPVLCLLLFASAVGTRAETNVIGQVKKVSGTAILVRGEERIAAKVGDPVLAGDAVETGADGRLGITFTDNTMFAAGPDTRLRLEEYAFDSDALQGNLLADLQQGTLSVVSGDLTKVSPEAMRVRTPRAILGVRGTEVLVRVDAGKGKGSGR